MVMGAIEFGRDSDHNEAPKVVLIKFLLAGAAIAMVDYFVFNYAAQPTLRNILIATGIHIAYCAVGFFIRPIPDESDMGLHGTVLNDTFSSSDDVNRNLFLLQLILLPGRYLTGLLLYFAAMPFRERL